MKRRAYPSCLLAYAFSFVLLGAGLAPLAAQAQEPPQRQIRAYIPPDQLVSFLPSTPFNRFVEFLGPIFQRVIGKQIVDPETRTEPIGLSIAGMQFLDAFELVLEYNGLMYRETDQFFIIEPDAGPAQQLIDAGLVDFGPQEPLVDLAPALLATRDTREIQINAMLFEMNLTKARDLGINWGSIFSSAAGAEGGGGGGGGGDEAGTGIQLFLKTQDLFENVSDLVTGPDEVNFSQISQLFRLLESEGVGETIANPQVTVQSGEQGRMQVGSDVPVQVRDFAGNTVTQFFSTGIIVDVKPTLIQEVLGDTLGAPTFDFIHLDVKVEKSGSRPSPSGLIIDRSSANTKVLLLDNEQTVIGGLYSTDETVSRKGIPFLKDLPGWFFGARYIFGRTERTMVQKELLIVLQAEVMDPLELRAGLQSQETVLEESRRLIQQRMERFSSRAGDVGPGTDRNKTKLIKNQ